MKNKLRSYQAKFENYTQLTASPVTADRYSRALDDFFNRFPEKTDPTQFVRVDIEDYRTTRLRDGLNPRTINYRIQIVRAFFEYLINMELTRWNPASKVRRLKEKEPERQSLSFEQQEQLYKSVAAYGSIQDRLLVGLALSTGLRAETMVQLETSNVDYEGSALRIPAEKMKAARNHDLPLRESELTLIRQLPEGRLFEGYAATAKALSYRWSQMCRRAGIPLRGLRLARRTFATTLIRNGVDLGVVQGLLAHKNIATTSRYLTPADEKTSRAAIEKLPISA